MDWYTQLDKSTAELLPDLRIACDEPMSRHTSFRIGGAAEAMAFPKNREELAQLMKMSGLLDTFFLIMILQKKCDRQLKIENTCDSI